MALRIALASGLCRAVLLCAAALCRDGSEVWVKSTGPVLTSKDNVGRLLQLPIRTEEGKERYGFAEEVLRQESMVLGGGLLCMVSDVGWRLGHGTPQSGQIRVVRRVHWAKDSKFAWRVRLGAHVPHPLTRTSPSP